MPEEKKKGVHVKIVDLDTGKELFSQEIAPTLAYCYCCWWYCCTYHCTILQQQTQTKT